MLCCCRSGLRPRRKQSPAWDNCAERTMLFLLQPPLAFCSKANSATPPLARGSPKGTADMSAVRGAGTRTFAVYVDLTAGVSCAD